MPPLPSRTKQVARRSIWHCERRDDSTTQSDSMLASRSRQWTETGPSWHSSCTKIQKPRSKKKTLATTRPKKNPKQQTYLYRGVVLALGSGAQTFLRSKPAELGSLRVVIVLLSVPNLVQLAGLVVANDDVRLQLAAVNGRVVQERDGGHALCALALV